MTEESPANPFLTQARIASIKLGAPQPIDPQVVPRMIEPFPVPEIVVDGVGALSISSGTLRLTLFSERPPIPPTPSDALAEGVIRVVVGRLAVSPEVANVIAIMLRTVLDQLVENKLIPPLPQVNVT